MKAAEGGATSSAVPSKKPKYEYDSDEEVDHEGTWEHKKRKAEMTKTLGRKLFYTCVLSRAIQQF